MDLKKPPWLNRNVLGLGLVALFTDAATEMAMPLLPAFLATLGGGAMALGWVDGMAELTAAVFKFISGRLSDQKRRRAPWVLGGYVLSSVARPLLALAATPLHAVWVRMADRVGKGLRSSPRDALLTASVPAASRGRAFGFNQSLDHLGAVIGPLVAVLLIESGWELRSIFWATAIPGAIAVTCILFLVREAEQGPVPEAPPLSLKPPSKRLRAFLFPLVLFTMACSSDLFLLMKAGGERVPLMGLPLLWMALHVVKSLSSIPGGWLADRIGSRPTIALGWALYAVIYAAFAFVGDTALLTLLFVGYGLFYGLTESAEKALITRLVGPEERGVGFGWYHLTVGVLVLPANLMFGWLFDNVSHSAAFLTTAAFAVAALLALMAAPLELAEEPFA